MGFTARIHSRALLQIPEAKITAIWSKFPEEHERFKQFSKKLGFDIPYYCTDLQKMLESPEVDAVICAIPWRFIRPIAEQVIKSGKPALLECPPGANLNEINELDRLAKQRGVKIMPGHCYRFAPCFKKAKELLKNIGDPTLIHFQELVAAASLARQWPRGSWIWKREHGGPVPTMTVFAMDFARWIVESEPSTVFSILKWQRLKDLGTTGYTLTATIKFKNGSVWNSEFSGSVSESLGSPMRLEILGEKGGAVVVDGPQRILFFGKRKEEKKEWQLKLERPERWGHKGQDEHFVRDVVGKGKDPAVTLKDAKKAFRMSLALLESSKIGKQVRVRL